MKSKYFWNYWKCSGFYNNVDVNLQPILLVKKDSSKNVVLRLRIPGKAFEKHFLKYHKNNSWLYAIIMSRTRFSANLHSKLPEGKWTSCSRQALYLKFNWQQRDSSPGPFTSQTNTQPFSQTGQTVELYCEYLFVQCIWLYAIIMSCTCFRVNLDSIVVWISKNVLLETGKISEV